MSKCIFRNYLGISLEVKMKDVPRVWCAPAPASQLSYPPCILCPAWLLSPLAFIWPHCCLSLIATTRGPGKWPSAWMTMIETVQFYKTFIWFKMLSWWDIALVSQPTCWMSPVCLSFHVGQVILNLKAATFRLHCVSLICICRWVFLQCILSSCRQGPRDCDWCHQS